MGESGEKAVAVISATKIPIGARSSYFSLDQSTLLKCPRSLENNLQVGIWSNSEIQPINASHQLAPFFWPKLVRLAPDCHAQNVQLSRVNGTVVLSAIKDILPGAELLLWFDQEILMDEMNIPPYLSPVHIRAGGNAYICNICGSSFEAPNYLKVHIALKCDSSLPVSVLWERLVSKATPTHSVTQHHSSTSPSHFWSLSNPPLFPNNNAIPITCAQYNLRNFKNASLSHLSRHHPVQLPTTTTASCSLLINPVSDQRSFLTQNGHHQHHQVYSESRATPTTTTTTNNSVPGQKSTPPTKPRLIRSYPQNRQNTKRRSGNPSVEKAISVSVSDPEAQLESIVSNMGKARGGHMCLYCGKLYSRKYGLKIHIRTHTGYKPLRCKICHRPFGDPSNLNKHIRLHSDGNTPYRCDICHKVLVRKRDLERHIRSRHTNSHPPHSSSSSGLPVPMSLAEGIALDCRTSVVHL